MFSLNSLKIFVITVKRFEPAISCIGDQDATIASATHMWETGSLNWPQFMFQWFIRFPEFVEFTEFPFHLGKTPISMFWGVSGKTLAYHTWGHSSNPFELQPKNYVTEFNKFSKSHLGKTLLCRLWVGLHWLDQERRYISS